MMFNIQEIPTSNQQPVLIGSGNCFVAGCQRQVQLLTTLLAITAYPLCLFSLCPNGRLLQKVARNLKMLSILVLQIPWNESGLPRLQISYRITPYLADLESASCVFLQDQTHDHHLWPCPLHYQTLSPCHSLTVPSQRSLPLLLSC